ncbi:MAG: hypothetical protein U9N59_03455, partial [Campylobacterota bacterium]|nr:hypothetical protein [Campylobacterota bacterium]
EQEKKQQLKHIPNITERRIKTGDGFSNTAYYIGLRNNSQEYFEINKYLSSDTLKSNFSTKEGQQFKNIIETSYTIDKKLQALKKAIEAESQKRYDDSVKKKELELENDFQNFKKKKIDEYHENIRRRFGNTNNARTGEVEKNNEAQRGNQVTAPLNAFKNNALDKRDKMIESFTNTIDNKLKEINNQFTNIEKQKHNDENNQRNQQIQKINNNAQKEINENNESLRTAEYQAQIDMGLTSYEIKMDKIFKAGYVKNQYKIHEEIIQEFKEKAQDNSKIKSKYLFDISQDKVRLKKEKAKFAEQYDKDIEITNFIHEGLLEEQIKQITYSVDSGFIPNASNIEKMERAIGYTDIVTQSKYAYELNMYINSIYEKNDPDNKLNSIKYCNIPELNIANDNKEILNINKNQNIIEQKDGKYKIHQGYHKIIGFDSDLTAAIFEWTGKYPTLTFFIPDPYQLKIQGQKGDDKFKEILMILDSNIRKNQKTEEIKDINLLLKAHKILKEHMFEDKDFIGNNSRYKITLHQIKLVIHSLLITHHLKLKRDVALFLDPFHFDIDEKPLGLKGTVGFMSDDDIRYIEEDKEFHNTYRNVISDNINDLSIEDPFYEPNIKKTHGLEYSIIQTNKINEMVKTNFNNIVYEQSPNGHQIKRDFESGTIEERNKMLGYKVNSEEVKKDGISGFFGAKEVVSTTDYNSSDKYYDFNKFMDMGKVHYGTAEPYKGMTYIGSPLKEKNDVTKINKMNIELKNMSNQLNSHQKDLNK